MSYRCVELIGRPYKLGADGSQAEIDCIHLVYKALAYMNIKAPKFKKSWYTDSKFSIHKELLSWGYKAEKAEYNGDVLLLPSDDWAFAVTWEKGILYINRVSMKSCWMPISQLKKYHCYRMRKN